MSAGSKPDEGRRSSDDSSPECPDITAYVAEAERTVVESVSLGEFVPPLESVQTPVAEDPAPLPPPPEPSAPQSAPREHHMDAPETESPSIEEPTAKDPLKDSPKALWNEPTPKRRPLPRRVVIAASIGAGLLLLPLVLGPRSPAPRTPPTSEKFAEELIINEKDLKNRISVSADDFRPKHVVRALTPASILSGREVAPALDPSKPDEVSSLTERRKRRADDPEDLISHRGRGSSGAKDKTQAEAESGGYRRPFVYFEPRGAGSSSSAGGSNAPLVQAGSTVPAVLSTPIEIHGGGSQTALARADSEGPLPKGSRFLGTAVSDADGRLSMRFSRLILPDGTEAKIEGEAQDPNGSFGLSGGAVSESEDAAHSAAGDIARDTAGDVATDALSTVTGGLAGRLARRALYRTSQNRDSGHLNRSVSLGQGATFQIFFHQAVVLTHPNEKGEIHAR